MASKKNFVLRIDEEVYRALEKWAADEFRSVNGQIEWLISQKLKDLNRFRHEGDHLEGRDLRDENKK